MSEQSSTGGAEQPIVGPDFLSWDESGPGGMPAQQEPSQPEAGPPEQPPAETPSFPPPQPAQAPTREPQEQPLPSVGQWSPAQAASSAAQPVQQPVAQQYPYQPAPHRPGPYTSYQPGAYIVQTPTGALSWFLGLIALIGFPFFNLIITGVVMIVVGSHQRRSGGTPGRFASQAMCWGIAVASISAVLLVLLYAVGLTTMTESSADAAALNSGFSLTALFWVLLTVVHLLVCVVQGIRASTAASRAGSVWS
ncbi:MAG: hypothetical protein ACFN04_10610 [Propionibacterium acidifaciens]